MPVTFEEMQSRLERATLREMILLAASGVQGRTFNELAAMRERLIDIAFNTDESPNEDRALAAVWSRSLESALLIVFEQDPDVRNGYLRARNSSMERALKFGYGTIPYVARTDPKSTFDRIWSGDGDRPEISEMKDRQAFLAGIAFGRGLDGES